MSGGGIFGGNDDFFQRLYMGAGDQESMGAHAFGQNGSNTDAPTSGGGRLTAEIARIMRSREAFLMTPATFATAYSDGGWIPAKHLLYISLVIAKAIRNGGGRIIISVPPRHGKSETFSVWTPRWILEKFPQAKILLSTYAAPLAEGFAERVRDFFLYPPEGIKTRLKTDSRSVANFKTTEGGGMASVGIRGALTGRGADVFLIDDYVKDVVEAKSESVRNAVWEWYQAVATTRLEPGATMIIIATRWDEDDLIGRILAKFSDRFTYIRMPALADSTDDILGRSQGEPLWPERYNRETLLEIKATLGTYFWDALYQQVPHADNQGFSSGAWLHIEDIAPELAKLRAVRSWDLASSPEKGDYTVGSLVGMDPLYGREHILDMERGQWSPAEVDNAMLQCAENDGKNIKVLIEKEPGSSGAHALNHFKTILRGYRVKEIKVSGPKPVRARPFLAYAEEGNVFMKRAPWNSAVIHEMDNFPDGENDDIVDSLAQAHNELFGVNPRKVIWSSKRNEQNEQNTKNINRNPSKGCIKFSTGATWGRRR